MSDSERMLAPVRIGGGGPYLFIVDTAAESSVISRALAEELALPRAGRARLLTMTNSHNAETVNVPDISFPPGRSHSLRAFTFDASDIGAAGILGIDALQGQRVVLDFEAGEMRLSPATRSAPLEPDEIVVRGRTRFGQLVLADADASGVQVDVIVDSGLQVTIGNAALRRLLASRSSGFRSITLRSITGEDMQAEYTTVENLRIGGFLIRGMPVAFADAYFFRRMQLERRPALMLGMDVMRVFRRVTVDFPNRRAQFLLPPSVPQRLAQ
jgi:predicted aspartyl protease